MILTLLLRRHMTCGVWIYVPELKVAEVCKRNLSHWVTALTNHRLPDDCSQPTLSARARHENVVEPNFLAQLTQQ